MAYIEVKNGCTQKNYTNFSHLTDFINENASVANPDPHSQNSLDHMSRFAVVVLMECWMEALYYYGNGKTLYQLHTSKSFTERGYTDHAAIHVTYVPDTQSIHARMHNKKYKMLPWLGKYWISCARNVLLHGKFIEAKI